MSEMELTESIGKPERPPLRYRGGKWRIGKWIIGFFPRHECYVEPFSGAAGVLFKKEPSPLECINDLDEDVVNFFKVLRERPKELVRSLELTPYSRSEHNLSYNPTDDPLEKARRIFVRCFIGRGSTSRRSGFRIQSKTYGWKSIKPKQFKTLEHLWAAADRLKYVQIECKPALDVIKAFDAPGTLFYVDPPYLGDCRPKSSKLYSHELMDESSHRELSEVLSDLQGMAIISGGQSDLYNDLYSGWRLETKVALGEQQKRYIECLWISPNAQRNHGQQEMEL